MAKKKSTTIKRVSSKAGKLIRGSKTSKRVKSVPGSALTQATGKIRGLKTKGTEGTGPKPRTPKTKKR